MQKLCHNKLDIQLLDNMSISIHSDQKKNHYINAINQPDLS